MPGHIRKLHTKALTMRTCKRGSLNNKIYIWFEIINIQEQLRGGRWETSSTKALQYAEATNRYDGYAGSKLARHFDGVGEAF